MTRERIEELLIGENKRLLTENALLLKALENLWGLLPVTVEPAEFLERGQSGLSSSEAEICWTIARALARIPEATK